MILENFPLAERDKLLLQNKIQSESLPQTLLLEGGTQALRRQLAEEIATALVCVGEGEKPCGTCRSCMKCKAKSHPDIQFYAPPKKNATFKVDTCREIRQDAFIVPNDGHNKVYILEEAQNMNDSGENALLKILEEPPKEVFFILTCQSASAMLPTILSRAMLLRLLDETEENFNSEVFELASEIAKTLANGSEMDTLFATAKLGKDRDSLKDFLEMLGAIFTAALLQKNGKTAAEPYAETAAILVNHLTEQKLYALINQTRELQDAVKRNANVNLLNTSLCYQLRRSVE